MARKEVGTGWVGPCCDWTCSSENNSQPPTVKTINSTSTIMERRTERLRALADRSAGCLLLAGFARTTGETPLTWVLVVQVAAVTGSADGEKTSPSETTEGGLSKKVPAFEGSCCHCSLPAKRAPIGSYK